MAGRGVCLLPVRAVIVKADILTPYGQGVATCFDALLQGRTAVAPFTRFSADEFPAGIAATIPDLVYHGQKSLVMQMLERLLPPESGLVPSDSALVLATTKGEIDLLEMSLLGRGGAAAESRLDNLLAKVARLAAVTGKAVVISSACTSSSAALARGASMIRAGKHDSVLVAACDAVTEFIFSGFSSLMALDSAPAKPFDKGRQGLSLGEGAGYALVMSEERALREGREILAEIAGWGMADDANHMTGPSRESEGLINAISLALASASAVTSDIDFISAHGTGTSYNDEMEMRAFNRLFATGKLPVYSIKGGTGHTMGAAGLFESLVAVEALRRATVPPTVNHLNTDDDASGWVSSAPVRLDRPKMALVTNSGFSGINTALIIKSNAGALR